MIQRSILSHIYYSVIFLLPFVLSACGNDINKIELDRAENVMEIEDDPRECLNLLQQMNYDSITSVKLKARYGYLYARSIHKLNKRMDSDLYIRQAVEYYQTKGDSPELMKALFYYSNYLFENDWSNEAIKLVMKARQLAIKYNDDYWRGKIVELIADILEHNHNNYETIKYRYESAQYYSKAGREDNARYCYVDLAIAYDNIHEYKKSIELADSILNIAVAEKDSTLIAYCYRTEYNAQIRTKEWEKGESGLNKFLSMSKFFEPSPHDYIYKAMIHVHKNEFDSAEIILNWVSDLRMTNIERKLLYVTLRNFYKKKKDFEKALIATDSIFNINNKDVRKSFSQVIVATQRDYIDEDLTITNLRAEHQRVFIIASLIVSAIIIIFIVLIFRYRLKVKRIESEKVIEQIMAVSDELSSENMRLTAAVKEHKKQISDMEDRLEEHSKNSVNTETLFQEKWEMLNFLCNEYFEKGDTPKTRATIVSRIENELKRFQSPESMAALENAVNKYMNGVASRLREQCDFLNESAILFVILCMAGLSQRAVCLLLDLSYNYYYTKKQRIATRIEQSAVPDRDLFLSYLK
ncbi:MAG: hypothetical protein K2K27_01465 [Muribaculaceae bacterium]|nr:hypothetical protein [Muribaculaceae bacterium]